MPVYVNNAWVATPDDLATVTSNVNALDRRLNSLESTVNNRVNELRNQITRAESRLKEYGDWLQRLDRDLRELDTRVTREVTRLNGVLDAISNQAARSTDLLGEISGHLSRNQLQIDELISLAQIETTDEQDRREEINQRLEQVLAQQRAQTERLLEVFTSLRKKLEELEQEEQKGANALEGSIREVSGALTDIQATLRTEIDRSTQSIDQFATKKAERSSEEANTLRDLNDMQERVRVHLVDIKQTMESLAHSGETAEQDQRARLANVRTRQAHQLNDEAARYLQSGKPDLAILLLEQAAGLAVDDVILTNLAQAYLLTGQFEQAEKVILRLAAQEKYAPQIFHQMGVFYLERSDAAAALIYLQKAVEMAPEDAGIWLSLGKAYYGCAQVGAAMAAWRVVAEKEPELIQEDLSLRMLYEEQLHLEGLA